MVSQKSLSIISNEKKITPLIPLEITFWFQTPYFSIIGIGYPLLKSEDFRNCSNEDKVAEHFIPLIIILQNALNWSAEKCQIP